MYASNSMYIVPGDVYVDSHGVCIQTYIHTLSQAHQCYFRSREGRRRAYRNYWFDHRLSNSAGSQTKQSNKAVILHNWCLAKATADGLFAQGMSFLIVYLVLMRFGVIFKSNYATSKTNYTTIERLITINISTWLLKVTI